MRVRRLILQTTTSQGTFGKSLAIIRRTSCGRFGLVYEHHAGRRRCRHLPHNLHADGTGRSGNEHFLSGQLLFHGFHVHANLLAREKILYAHFLQLHVLLDFSIEDGRFGSVVHDENLHALADEDVLHLLVGAEVFEPIRGNEDGLDAFLVDNLFQVVVQVVHLQAEEFQILDPVLVGQEAADVEFARPTPPDRAP